MTIKKTSCDNIKILSSNSSLVQKHLQPFEDKKIFEEIKAVFTTVNNCTWDTWADWGECLIKCSDLKDGIIDGERKRMRRCPCK